MSVLLKQVAQKAGVSETTASRILNGDGAAYADATRDRVMTAAQTLGYTARQPRRRRPPHRTRIGVLATAATSYSSAVFNQHLLRTIASVADFQPIEFTRDYGTADDLLTVIEHARVQGLMFTGLDTTWPRELITRAMAEYPTVFFNTSSEMFSLLDLPLDQVVCVATDRAAGTRQAVDHLVSLGHAAIAFLPVGPRTRKYAGYLQAMEAHGLPIPVSVSVTEPMTPMMCDACCGRDVAEELLARDALPTAIILPSDQTAMGLMSRLDQADVRVPEDISIIGWDGTELGAHTCPPLTSVAQPYHQIAEQCLALLSLWLTTGEPPSTGVRLVEPSLMLRSSTAPPRMASGNGAGAS